jgi:GNAT superfamily N-acetyltransferase
MFAIGEGAADHMEKNFLRPAMQDKNHLVILALGDGKTVGYAVARINERLPTKHDFMTGVVDHLFVTQDCRHRGVGEQMYLEIIRWFKAANINRVEVQIIGKNKVACAFWKKQGYGDFEYIWEREI